MSYKVKILKKNITETFDMVGQYRKFISVCFKDKKCHLASRILRVCRAHYKYGISPLLYSYYRLGNVPESLWAEYVVDQNKFNQLLAGNSTVDERRNAGNKLQFYRHCINNNLPIIPIYCVVSNDRTLSTDIVTIVDSLKEWREAIPSLPDEFFIKPILGASGVDSFSVYKENDSFKFDGCSGSLEDLFEYLQGKLKPGQGFIVQPKKKTHSDLADIVSSHGLSTVRVVTLRCDGSSKIIMACLKMIRGENEHDNFSKGMSNNLITPMNIDTGELMSAWGSLRSDWPEMVQYSIHPDSGAKIDGFLLPLWSEISELVLRAQESLPFLQTIGWDIALTDEGLFIVEANTAYDAASFQLFEKRGMKSEFQRLFGNPSEQVMITN